VKIVALIPMRAGSKRIPGKHVTQIGGFSPALRVLNAALGTMEIETVYVATNDPDVKTALEGKEKHFRYFPRSEKSATDAARTESLIGEFLKHVDCDIVVLIQATNPFTKAYHLKKALAQMEEQKADSVVSGVLMKRYFYAKLGHVMIEPQNRDTLRRVGLANVRGLFVENGAFYIFRSSAFRMTGDILSGVVIGYEMGFESLIELDEPADWNLANSILSDPHYAITQ
jgi:N-acylneuraminate cytidylyltransferase